MTTKQELRRQVRALKKAHAAEQLSAASQQLCRKVLGMACWQAADTLLLYHPLPDEVDVRPLIAAGYQQGKRVLLPVCVGDSLELRIYQGEASLSVGSFGILEPTGPLFSAQDCCQIQLALIPGMAFDAEGHRLGRGKGYYDRLLPGLTEAHLIGICYDFQLLDAVPSEPHDCLVHEVVTNAAG